MAAAQFSTFPGLPAGPVDGADTRDTGTREGGATNGRPAAGRRQDTGSVPDPMNLTGPEGESPCSTRQTRQRVD
jgi:hypothetical protein